MLAQPVGEARGFNCRVKGFRLRGYSPVCLVIQRAQELPLTMTYKARRVELVQERLVLIFCRCRDRASRKTVGGSQGSHHVTVVHKNLYHGPRSQTTLFRKFQSSCILTDSQMLGRPRAFLMVLCASSWSRPAQTFAMHRVSCGGAAVGNKVGKFASFPRALGPCHRSSERARQYAHPCQLYAPTPPVDLHAQTHEHANTDCARINQSGSGLHGVATRTRVLEIYLGHVWDIYQECSRTYMGHSSRVYVSLSHGLNSDTHRERKIYLHACPVHM